MSKRIIFLSEMDYSAVASRLTEAINKHTDWEAMCVVKSLTRGGEYIQSIQSPQSTFVYNENEATVKDFIQTADVVIWGNYPGWKLNGATNLIRKNAIRAVWWTGSNYRAKSEQMIEAYHKNMDIIFAHRDLENLCPGTIRLEQPFDFDLCTPNQSGDKILIGHSPSDPNKLWKKGTHHFTNAMRKITRDYGNRVETILMKDMHQKDLLEWKGRLHIFFDQIGGYYMPRNGVHGYGMSLVEASAGGAVCLCWSDYPDTPIIHVETGADIEMAIERLMDNPAELKRIGELTRKWAFRTHSQDNVAKRLVALLDIHYNKKHPNFKAIEKVVHSSGFPNMLPGDVLWLRDIPTPGTKIKPNKKDMIKKAKAFIGVGTKARGAFAKETLIKRDIPFTTFPNYQNYIPTLDDKRDEIVYVDNSSSNCDNYGEIVDILQDIHERTNLGVVFCCRRKFVADLKKLVTKTDVIPMCREDYDYNGKYGIFIDAFSNTRYTLTDDYITGYYRKFWLYLGCGIMPIILSKCKDMITLCERVGINHIKYDSPASIQIDDKLYCNWNKYKYTFEYNFIILEHIRSNLSGCEG